MQQRYYDPVIGRFYSNDPVGFTADNPMSFNRYLYVNNNPYKYKDPEGESLVHAVAFAVGAAVSMYQTYNSTGGDVTATLKSGAIGGVSAALSLSPGGLATNVMKSFAVGSVADATAQVVVDGKDVGDIDVKQSLSSGTSAAAGTVMGTKIGQMVPVKNMPSVKEPNVPAGWTQRMTENPGTLQGDKTKQGAVGAAVGAVAGGTSGMTEERLREQ
jgi:uncharacterized protein RhaS with RHS repeats